MNIIETSHLSKFYGRSKGISDINLEVKQGDIFGFIGPNGAGKSTTIRILLNMIFPTTGLDPLIQAKFFELLRNENKNGTTIFFSSHVLSDVQALCRTVAVIRDGMIVNVEDVATLRQKQLKKVKIGFTAKMLPQNFRVKGMASVEIIDGTTVSFLFSGEIKDLVREISDLEIKHLIIEEPSLEEIFLHYYN